MLIESPHKTRTMTGLVLGLVLFCSGCGMFSEQTLIKGGQDGSVYLQRLSNRGTTARYSGPLKTFTASHPVTVAPEVLAKALAGLHVGILPPDRQSGSSEGIKPMPLLTPREIVFLAPAIASALQQASSDQRVKFQVGPETDRTDGTIYVDGAALRIALGRYHTAAQSNDTQLSIYALSFKPEQAQLAASGPQSWMEIEPDQPRLALALDALTLIPTPTLPPLQSFPQTTTDPAPGPETRRVNELVNKQAHELEALKAELEVLKKQLTAPSPTPDSKTGPNPIP